MPRGRGSPQGCGGRQAGTDSKRLWNLQGIWVGPLRGCRTRRQITRATQKQCRLEGPTFETTSGRSMVRAVTEQPTRRLFGSLLCALVGLGWASDGLGLDQPSPMPPPGTVCTFEGVFAGTQEVGRWSYRVATATEYTVTFSSASLLHGVLEQRLGEPFEITSATMDGSERPNGPMVQGFERLTIELSLDGGRRAATVANTLRTESACSSMPRRVREGERWTCRERVSDSWEVKAGTVDGPSGTETSRSEPEVHYVRDEEIPHPVTGQPVKAALLEVRDDEQGRHERLWVDPALPWCTLKVERLKLDRVVGSIVLVELAMAQPEDEQPPVGKHDGRSWIWIGLALGLGVGAVGLAGLLFVRRRRRRARSTGGTTE